MDDDYVPGQRRMGAGAIIVISVLLSTAASVLAVRGLLEAGLLLPHATVGQAGPVTETRVPDVVGMAADAADELLSARKLRMVVSERRADERIAKDAIVSQAPLAQSRVNASSEVTVVVSTGASTKKIPALVGQKLEEAKLALEQAGLVLGPVSETDDGPAGTVTATVPIMGTEVEPGSPVAMTVAVAKIEVPRVVGMPIARAREVLENAQLKVGSVSEIYDRHKKGLLVLQQDPDPGERVGAGAEIKLVINQGD
jgi:beta-lactam-binding protein with PASTA domain